MIRTSMPIKAGIVGTGYIASFHARAITSRDNVTLEGVCDSNLEAARRFATNWGEPAVFESLDQMLSGTQLDVVHVLAPPDQHHDLALRALSSGVHVLLEKPICISSEETNNLLTVCQANGLKVGVNHNFLFARSYGRLREIIHSGLFGPIKYIGLNYFYELPQIRLGPFDSWMLRAPGNAILEIGPHLVSALLDLIGEPKSLTAVADRELILPNGAKMFRRWRIRGDLDRTAVDININLEPGFGQRTIYVHGQYGSALVDFDANTCTIDRRTTLSFDLDRFVRSRSQARQILSQARRTLGDYLLSTLKLRRVSTPYQATFNDSIDSFYASVSANEPLDTRIDAKMGRNVIAWCERIVSAAGAREANPPRIARRNVPSVMPTVLVFGGSGFIGRELIRQLLAAKYAVRAVIHRSSSSLENLESDHLEIVKGDIASQPDLKRFMRGINYVFHLARAHALTWGDYLKNDVKPTRLIAEACLEAGVKRLIYTGTIASYYTGAGAGTITEQTPLDPKIARRDNYSRAKAEAEALLMEMHRTRQLPVIIFRPGIVIGPHGTPFHWGIGMWVAESLCQVWGEGTNKLPFVLVQDVASALIQSMLVPNIEGRAYNLVDLPLLSARDYLEELQRQAGIRLDIRYGSILHFYCSDALKWMVKVLVRHPDRGRVPSYRDWESRTQKAIFDCSRARTELIWRPASDRQRLIEEGLGDSLRTWEAYQ
jgi:predicted dehydrogenase/nucleoside-diphosphate-sugar epimerase